MTPIEACQETRELWTKLAKISIKRKVRLSKREVFGPWINYANHCPCCEYACSKQERKLNCYYCPMLKEWNFYSTDSECPCQGVTSPYERWRRDNLLCIDLEFFCLLIADLAEEAEMELKNEEKDNDN